MNDTVEAERGPVDEQQPVETDASKAAVYRMVTKEHTCPFGLKSLDLLRREGFQIEDHQLQTREQADMFMQEHGVETTPQTFIGGKRIGGYDQLREHFGKQMEGVAAGETSYKPILAIFSVAFLMALAALWAVHGEIRVVGILEWFIAFSMCILAVQKLQDLTSFSNMFLGYDLLAQRQVRYAYFYPFGEALAGILMIAGTLLWIAIPVALFIGTIGAVSVFKAVYIDKRELKCACAGGNSKVPLGFVSLTENIAMVGMAVWMLLK